MKQLHTRITALTTILILSAATSHAADSRLIAQSHYNANAGNLIAYDSASYIYPSNTTALFSQKLTYMYNNAWIHMRKQDNTYNTAGKLTHMQFQNWSTSTNAYINGGMTFFTLNSAGDCIKDSNLLWIPANNAYRNNVRNTYTLNSAGQITDKVYEYWDFGANDLLPHYHYTNTYNAQGKPLVGLTQEWDASIHWVDNNRVTYVYDASGIKLQSLTGEQSITFASPLQTVYQNVFTYNPDGTVASYLSNMWNAASSSWKPGMRITMSYDASGNNTLETQESWDVATNAYKPYQQMVRTYNSHNQKTSETRMAWGGSAYSIASDKDNYYYEDYNTTTSIANASAETAWLSLAPIPSTGTLHLAIKWTEAQAFTVLITDMNGRVCQRFAAPAEKEYQDDLDLSTLVAGNYVLAIRGERGATITRMIVMQH